MTSVVADARPQGINIPFRPGNTLTVELTWPTGQLAGRTFVSTLAGVALSCAVVGDSVVVEASEAQTAAVSAAAAWLLTETTGGGTNDLFIGTWVASTDPGTPTSLTIPVAVGDVDVTVTVASGQSSILALNTAKVNRAGDTMTGGLTLSGGADLTVTGDTTISGQILTGTFGSPATFGGIEREGRVFPAGEMCSPTAVMNFGDGFPRVNMPSNVTTDVYMIIEIEEWWLDSTIGVYFEWVNDHTAADGAVRFDCEIKECDIHTEALAAADVIASRTFTHDLTGGTGPAANTATTSIVASIVNGNPVTFDPGPIASFYVLRISRLGADAADTLAGPIGLLAASMTRGQ